MLSGELEVSRRAADGAVVPLGALKTGDVFGEMAIVRIRAHDRDRDRAASGDRAVPRARVRRRAWSRAFPEIKSYLEALAEDREIDNQLALGEDETPSDERILI